MTSARDIQEIVFENVWGKDIAHINAEIRKIWEDHGGPVGAKADARLRQLVFVVKDSNGRVIGISTAFKAYIPRLRNHFYAIRLMLVPESRVPGLSSKLLVSTRDFFESIHAGEETDRAIGIITMVENAQLKEHRNEAVWPASGMVYIGNSAEGHHIRVYYFKGARIIP